MGGTPRLVRRNGVFYFRMAVPQEWLTALGRREVKTTPRTTDRVKATLLCRNISNDLDVFFSNNWIMTHTPLENIDQRIRDIFQNALNEGHSFRQVFGPDIDKDDEAESVDARHQSLAAILHSQHYDKALLSEAKALVGKLPDNQPFRRDLSCL